MTGAAKQLMIIPAHSKEKAFTDTLQGTKDKLLLAINIGLLRSVVAFALSLSGMFCAGDG